jgi:hypothetical protein
LALLFLAAIFAVHSVQAGELAPSTNKFATIAPLADLAAEAKARNIPLSGIDPVGEAGVLNPGDSFTALVTLCQKGGKRTQWALYLRALPADGNDSSAKPRKPMVLYSGQSNRFEFAS